MDHSLRVLFEVSERYKNKISESSNTEEVSKFYIACRDGDVDTVKMILPTIPYDQLNRLESNESTPLHIATLHGHSKIVRLLLHDYSCQRHVRDRQGLTAYEEAQTDQIRQLYHRPTGINRFNDDSDQAKDSIQLVTSTSNDDEDEEDDSIVTKPDQRYLIGYEANEDISQGLENLNGVKAFFQSRLGRLIMGQGMKLQLAKETGYTEEEYSYVTSKKFREEALRKVLDEHVTPNHPEYKHCCHLLNEYIEHGTIESLLKLYTLETPFYHQLVILSSPLGFPFFMHLADLKQRYYQGYSYRGVLLTSQQINEYRWAWEHANSILCILTFSSTSMIREVAEQFSVNTSRSSKKIPTLFIYHFPQPCDTAINLCALPEYQLPCISNYENEKEVLISPRTIFKVVDIQSDRLNDRCTICLENLCGQQETVLKALKRFLKNDLKKKTNKLFHSK